METKDILVSIELAPGETVVCLCPARIAIHGGDRCVMDSGGILESGEIVGIGSSADVEDGRIYPELIRCETLQDQAKVRENTLMAEMAKESCLKSIKALGLQMRLVRVRYSFDRKLLLVIFAADDRVDFRELVKQLANEYHCRVELRQIGVRDEAALVGGFGPCGRVQCCTAWLKRFDAVNVRMARTQHLSLNPIAISGMCGRLKCCLRYEEDQYQEALHGLPREGAHVECPEGTGRVVELKTLQRRVRVRLEDDRILEYDVSDISPAARRPMRRCPKLEEERR